MKPAIIEHGPLDEVIKLSLQQFREELGRTKVSHGLLLQVHGPATVHIQRPSEYMSR